jgi:hypothetical protein
VDEHFWELPIRGGRDKTTGDKRQSNERHEEATPRRARSGRHHGLLCMTGRRAEVAAIDLSKMLACTNDGGSAGRMIAEINPVAGSWQERTRRRVHFVIAVGLRVNVGEPVGSTPGGSADAVPENGFASLATDHSSDTGPPAGFVMHAKSKPSLMAAEP